MAENNLSGIRPLDSLQTIKGLDPVDRHKERKQQQNNPEQSEEQAVQTSENDETVSSDSPNDSENEHTIDFCA